MTRLIYKFYLIIHKAINHIFLQRICSTNMTHTLHRVGDRKSLKKDFVVYGLSAQDAELVGRVPEKRDTRKSHTRFMEICTKHGPVNAGCIYPSSEPYSKTLAKGNTWLDDMKPEMLPFTETLAVFDDPEKVSAVLRDLKEEDLGMSIVVSGIFDEVNKCCGEAGLTRHTVNMALGIWGRQDLIPERKVLDVVTMCGHGLVSRHLVKELVNRVRKGAMTANEAGTLLGAQCVCGAFNTERASDLIKEMVAEGEGLKE